MTSRSGDGFYTKTTVPSSDSLHPLSDRVSGRSRESHHCRCQKGRCTSCVCAQAKRKCGEHCHGKSKKNLNCSNASTRSPSNNQGQDKERANKLREMGFDPRQDDPSLPIDEVVLNLLSKLKAVDHSAPLERSPEPSAPSTPHVPAPSEPSTSTMREAECLICMEQERTMAFVPCGHKCCCPPCSKTQVNCPVCRTPVQQAIKIYD